MVQRANGRRAWAGLLAAAVALALLPGAARAEQPHPFKGKRQVTVMTRNLYIGASLDPIFAAQTFPQLVGAVTTAFLEVQATRFPERAQAIAGEIAETSPEVIGLQEVEIIRTDTPADGAATPAETVLYDYLDILLASLAARGLHYAPVAVVQNSDTELPSALGFDVRATDRDVILVRTDLRRADLKWRNPQAANFATNLTIPTLGGPITLLRGWNALDVKIRGKKFRLVNTHLETEAAPPIQAAQALELLAGPGATSRPTLFIGDFNSQADGLGTPTYGILRAAGFGDAWSDTHPGDPGLTCCWEAHLLSPVPPFDERIDLVLHRGGFTTLSAEIVGEDAAADRTPSGLFHSDHAGVVATLQLTG